MTSVEAYHIRLSHVYMTKYFKLVKIYMPEKIKVMAQ